MSEQRQAVVDVVKLRVDSGRWPAGTVATVVKEDENQALIEISDDRGHDLDLISVPHDALAPRHDTNARLAS
jgi:chemotaxis protein histidine kinase CheA